MIDKADDHGIDELLPAQVIPVVSVVGLEQVLAELHRRPRRAIDLLAGRDCCEVDAPTAHAEVAGSEAFGENELSDLYFQAGQVERATHIAAGKQGRGKEGLAVWEMWADLARRVVEEHLHASQVFVLPALQGVIQLDELISLRLRAAHAWRGTRKVILWPSATWSSVSYRGFWQRGHFSHALCLIPAE